MSGVNRASLLGSYLDTITNYLSMKYPKESKETIKGYVEEYIKEHIKRPKAAIVDYFSYGNQELKKVDLLSLVRKYRNKTISPCGTIFETTDVRVPTVKEFLDALVKKRDTAKKAMFKYIEQGKKLEAAAKNSEQQLNKIAANSVSGGCGTKFSAFYDLETYSSITSMCRHGTMMAYTFAERFLASNYYFPTIEDAVNFVMTTIQSCPSDSDIDSILREYMLLDIWPEDILQLLVTGLDKYVHLTDVDMRYLSEVCQGLSRGQCTYIYYARNLYNLYSKNEYVFHNLFIHLFTLDKDTTCMTRSDVDVSYLKEADGDLIQALQTIYNDYLGGKVIKKIIDSDKELALNIARIARTFQDILDYWQPVIDMFLHAKTMVHRVHVNKYMIRRVIIVSDTDSIIYTSKDLVMKFIGGEFSYDKEYVYACHALVTYFLCKSVMSQLRMIAISRGACGEDNIKMLKMKNEFFYPVFLRTQLRKHYIGLRTIQEGVVLPDPYVDCKGLGFKSSNVPSVTHKFTDKLIDDLLNDINTHTNVYAGDYIARVLEYERYIYDTIQSGDLTYFSNISVKKKEEYKVPEVSIYINYLFWQEVFAKKYGDIFVPNKCLLVPFIKNKYKSESYLAYLEMKDPSIYASYRKFLEKNPDKPINRLPIPMTCLTLPEEIKPLVDIRAITYKNMSSAQLLLKCLGVDLGDSKKMPLLSDYYTTSLEEGV